MSEPVIIDFFVRVRPDDKSRVAQVREAQEEIETGHCTAAALVRMGEILFNLAFPCPADFVNQLASAARGDNVLRLWIDADEQASSLPWEYLCLPETAAFECGKAGRSIAKEQRFLALHPNVSLVRQCGDAQAGGPLHRIGKLRVLVAWAQPATWPAIAGLKAETDAVAQTLHQMRDSHVVIEVVGEVTPMALRERMSAFKPHVLHYAGHGAFPCDDLPDLAEPSLVLHGGSGHAYLGGAELRAWCADAGVQVVVLNSCLGAKGTPGVSALARTLTTPGVGRAVPVVVAHQMEVAQAAASGFARPFYQDLVIGRPLEEGVRKYRLDCVSASHDGLASPDWGVPVVYLGTRETPLFRYERVDLYPLDFGEMIREHVPIVGRRFVRDEIDKFMTAKPSGVFLLTAPPGIGKTAFVAQLCEDDPTRTYFFYRAAAGMTDPDEWVRSTFAGLKGRYGIEETNPTTDRAELRTRLKQWLLPKVSQACAERGKKELILLDALDESGRTSQDYKTALDVLPEKLPPHVYLLVTSRPGPLAEACARRADCAGAYALDPASADNRDDAAGFCARELRRMMADELSRLGAMLAQKAEGNFLVLKLFFGREALRGQVDAATIEREAADLSGDVWKEYDRFFARIVDDVADDRESMKLLNRVLGAFVTARAPVTQQQIGSAFAVDADDWEWSLRKVAQFLAGGGLRQEERGARTYRIYHETFREFLQKKYETRLGEYHGRWADHAEGWRGLTGYAQMYALRHLVQHLIATAKGGG